MDAHELARMQSLFDAALELPEEEREAFVARECADDSALRDQLRRLLREGDTTGDAFVRGAVHAAVHAVGRGADHRGRVLGAYRLLHELGRGGMGTVWLAERADQAYRAQVAIKLVRDAFGSEELARRFREERQILADLTHPHIAGLLDGGEAPDGTPYLVMEYITGEPITTWAVHHALPLRRRLQLFCLVCQAVQHAHAALVIHRDIKPSNILVTEAGTPKLLDFGIAKLLAPGASTETTLIARRLTPSYASPEQLRGERVTVATDVYSLGVLLFELVADAHPFAEPGMSTDELRRRVLENEPPRASDALRRAGTSFGVAPQELAGDVDNIIARAMRKEPERRYASAAQLAEDVGRMLTGEPVLARPASATYRMRKFVARHTVGVVAAATLLIALAGGMATTLWQARRADRARRAAESALAQSNAVKQFLLDLFRASDPDERRGTQITVRELLERGVQRVDSLRGQPALQAELLATLAHVEVSLADYRAAEGMFTREIALRRALRSTPDEPTLDAMTGRALALEELGHADSAAAGYARVVAEGAPILGDTAQVVLSALVELAGEYVRLGRDREADSMYRHVIALQRQTLDPDAPGRVNALGNYGWMLATAGRFAEAEPRLREALRIVLLTDTAGTSADAAALLDNLGMTLRDAGRYDDAETFFRRELAARLKVLGPEHRYIADPAFGLGLTLALRGEPDDLVEADSLLHLSFDVYRTTLGPTHRAVGYSLWALGVLALRNGRPAEAERWLRDALTIRRTTSGDAPRETVRTLVWLGEAQLAAGEESAETSFREADSLARSTLAATDPVRTRAAVGVALAAAHRVGAPAVASDFHEAIGLLAQELGPEHPFVRHACAQARSVSLDSGCES
ncbi:MAG TPA: tetratricopeptide repeat protein [Gemmatimonadaceae bacterium]|nr:tetratricopeptide repeat protein [Gemmatimonadaceae bacterium]